MKTCYDPTDPNSYAEADYQRAAEPAKQPQFLQGTNIEIVRPLARRDPPRHVLFDFDGTLSLIREGWPEVMVPMMVEVLHALLDRNGTDIGVEIGDGKPGQFPIARARLQCRLNQTPKSGSAALIKRLASAIVR